MSCIFLTLFFKSCNFIFKSENIFHKNPSWSFLSKEYLYECLKSKIKAIITSFYMYSMLKRNLALLFIQKDSILFPHNCIDIWQEKSYEKPTLECISFNVLIKVFAWSTSSGKATNPTAP